MYPIKGVIISTLADHDDEATRNEDVAHGGGDVQRTHAPGFSVLTVCQTQLAGPLLNLGLNLPVSSTSNQKKHTVCLFYLALPRHNDVHEVSGVAFSDDGGSLGTPRQPYMRGYSS